MKTVSEQNDESHYSIQEFEAARDWADSLVFRQIQYFLTAAGLFVLFLVYLTLDDTGPTAEQWTLIIPMGIAILLSNMRLFPSADRTFYLVSGILYFLGALLFSVYLYQYGKSWEMWTIGVIFVVTFGGAAIGDIDNYAEFPDKPSVFCLYRLLREMQKGSDRVIQFRSDQGRLKILLLDHCIIMREGIERIAILPEDQFVLSAKPWSAKRAYVAVRWANPWVRHGGPIVENRGKMRNADVAKYESWKQGSKYSPAREKEVSLNLDASNEPTKLAPTVATEDARRQSSGVRAEFQTLEGAMGHEDKRTLYDDIAPKARQRAQELLDKRGLEPAQKEDELDEWVRLYHDLDKHLEVEGWQSDYARQAQELLHDGLLEKAGSLLALPLASHETSEEQIASSYFSRARVLSLQFNSDAALPYYANAYQVCPKNPIYALSYADVLHKQNRHFDAESVYLSILQILREMAKTDASTYLPQVAKTLDNLGSLYKDVQQENQSEAMYGESLTIHRQLAQTNPAAFLPRVAVLLNSLGILYKNTNRIQQAKAMYEESLTIHRQLAQTDPNLSKRGVAGTLYNLGHLYEDTHQQKQAEAMYQEALTIHRQLVQTNPAAFLPELAMTLNSLGLLYEETSREKQAEAMYQEALSIYRQLAESDPTSYQPGVALMLNNLGALCHEAQRLQQAEAMYQEALSIYRQLAESDPHRRGMPRTLKNLGALYEDTHRQEQAKAMYQEANQLSQDLS